MTPSPQAQAQRIDAMPADHSVVHDEATLREALKRCSPETIEAAVAFHRTGDHHLVPRVVIGIIERFVERDLRVRVLAGGPELRLSEDLGIDSLTMIEIVMLTEEALRITINNDELSPLRTLGDVQTFAECKARGLDLPASLRETFRESVNGNTTGLPAVTTSRT